MARNDWGKWFSLQYFSVREDLGTQGHKDTRVLSTLTSVRQFASQAAGFRQILTLGGLWLVAALGDRLWLAFDHAAPTWDPTNHLTGSLNYWHILQHPQGFLPNGGSASGC